MSEHIKWNESKKFLIAAKCLILTAIVWLVSLILMCIKPEISPSVVQLSSLVVGIFGGIATFYLTGQSMVEMKINQNNTSESKSSNVVEKKENINIEEKRLVEMKERTESRKKDSDYKII